MAKVINLGNFNISEGNDTGTEVTGLDISGLSIQVNFSYTSGGTSCKFYLQTSLDQGNTWFDILCFSFTTADLVKVVGMDGSKSSAIFSPTDGSLTDNTWISGVFGDRLRGKVVVVDDYIDTNLYIRATVR